MPELTFVLFWYSLRNVLPDEWINKQIISSHAVWEQEEKLAAAQERHTDWFSAAEAARTLVNLRRAGNKFDATVNYLLFITNQSQWWFSSDKHLNFEFLWTLWPDIQYIIYFLFLIFLFEEKNTVG